MIPTPSKALLAAVALPFVFSAPLMASEEKDAKRMCKSKMEEVYGVDRFRDLWVDQEGNHKFRVYGKVKIDDHKYDFSCKVKRGEIRSYAYEGPHKRHRDDDGNDDVGAAIAVGAGLAILAAVAASSSDDSDERNKSAELPVSKSVLEDECHDMLQYRIRDEHDYTARVTMRGSELEGHDLVGDAKVKYEREDPQHATYSCHFDNRGRLMDSSYHLY